MIAFVAEERFPGSRGKGFTLIELSIVLVIIGLIVGGIMTGQSLIRSAELKSVMSDVTKYVTAVNTFRTKYDALPGDMVNATSMWGAVNSNPVVCAATVGTGTQTCNGDGNGQISNPSDQTTWYEWFRAWQHLALAGLIPGNFTGVAGAPTPGNAIIDTNVPHSRISGGGYTIFYAGGAASTEYFNDNYGHIIFFGAADPTLWTLDPILKANEAYAFDAKYDDGMPGSGRIMTLESTSAVTPNCATTAVATTAVYNMTSSGQVCSLIFKLGF